MLEKAKKNPLLLVGAGYMAKEYARVLQAIDQEFIVVGRSQKSADDFKKSTGINVVTLGIKNWLKNNQKSNLKTAIVAVSEENLGRTVRDLLYADFKNILVEKPGGLNTSDIIKTQKISAQKNVKVAIAYNRRFYSSTIEAIKIIKKDGGVLSFFFDFTEWSNIVQSIKKSSKIKEKWFLNNSTHVVDLAFYLGGKPSKFYSYQSGRTVWHKKGSVFSGAGITTKNAIFSYQANWQSPGRWGVEIFTKKHRLIFRPLERLFIQSHGSLEVKEIFSKHKYDLTYKPGLFRQTKAFLDKDFTDFCMIKEQVGNLKFYKKICSE